MNYDVKVKRKVHIQLNRQPDYCRIVVVFLFFSFMTDIKNGAFRC